MTVDDDGDDRGAGVGGWSVVVVVVRCQSGDKDIT